MRHVPSRRPSGQLGEELGVIDLVGAKRSTATPELTPTNVVSVLRKHRDVDAVSLFPKKDLRRVEMEEVLVVGVDVERLVREDVCEDVDVRICL